MKTKEELHKQLKRLEQENKMLQELKDEDSLRVVQLAKENAELKEELQKYKDMEANGLEEFKDVGGCWGCGIQSASDQYFNDAKKYRHTLEEIRSYVNTQLDGFGNDVYGITKNQITTITNKINEVLNEE